MKIERGASCGGDAAVDVAASPLGGGDRTRDAVARTVLEQGPQHAAGLAERLGVSAAAIRRHLDALVADGVLVEQQARPSTTRGRGRPARTYALTDLGRASFPHAYDDLATTALRYLRESGGTTAVDAFAEHRAQSLADRLVESIDARSSLPERAQALAGALTAHGYASTVQTMRRPVLPPTPSATPQPMPAANSVQICQHHCPVAHVAAEFPQLCEAETRAFERVLGTYVQRLATIAHGDGVCTTHVPLPNDPNILNDAPSRPDPSGRQHR